LLRRRFCSYLCLIVVSTVCLLAAGCASPDSVASHLPSLAYIHGNRTPDSGKTDTALVPGPPPKPISVEDIPLVSLMPAWEVSCPRLAAASAFSTCDRVCVASDYGWGWSRRYLVQVLSSEGDEIWSYRVPYSSAVSCDTRVLSAEGHVGVAVYRSSGVGLFVLLDPEGNVLASRDVSSSVKPLMFQDAVGWGLYEQLTGVLHLFEPDGSFVRRLNVGRGAEFSAVGRALLVKGVSSIWLLQPDGEETMRYDTGRWMWCDVAMSPGGGIVALTTAAPNSMLYVYDSQGNLLWKTMLAHDGTKRLRFSPDGSLLAVYNVGSTAGLYLFSVSDGTPVWRHYFLDPEADMIALRNLAWADNGMLSAHYVRSLHTPSTNLEDHYIISFDSDGGEIGRLRLGTNCEVCLAQSGFGIAVASGEWNNSGTQYIMDRVLYYNLRSLLTSSQ